MPSSLNLTFAKKFKEYRKRSIINGKQLSGESLSALLTERITYVSKSVVYNWENGQIGGILEERKIQIGVIQIFIEGRGMACERQEIDHFLRLGRFISLDEGEWQNFVQKYPPSTRQNAFQHRLPHPTVPFVPGSVADENLEQNQPPLDQPLLDQSSLNIAPANSTQPLQKSTWLRWLTNMLVVCWFISPFTAHQSRLPITESEILGRNTGKAISQRAFEWANFATESTKQPSDGSNHLPSAFISRVWNTALTSKDLDTYLRENSTRISFIDIQMGDVIVAGNETPQVIVFHRWIQTLRRLEGFIFHSSSQKIRMFQYEVQFTQNGFTIQNQDLLNATAVQSAYRYNQIPGYVNLISIPQLNNSAPTMGEYITLQFSIRNNGGQPVTLLALTAGARGASHSQPTWASTNVDFPAVYQITLQPGQHYTYKQSRAFYATGNYFAEPVKNQGTWSSLPIEQKGTSILGWNRIAFTVLP
jgi:hypothetical protein